MTSNRATENQNETSVSTKDRINSSYYALLGLHPAASPVEIRRAYRELSKRYHPDTTNLPKAIATSKFQQLNEAYATLSNPERRLTYDYQIGYSRVAVVQPKPNLHQPVQKTSSAYLDPTDRPLDGGEIFALFLLLLTFIGCLALAFFVALTRGETALQPIVTDTANQTILKQATPTPVSSFPVHSAPSLG
ncbi:J domain-containing protein [Phormidium sp. LEGE 05292]|uniref:J domain-containing protein n=1 Tax=[Phormidium] sp. LEGE 05292 TaxID=767427 RepID=UPI001880B0A0|nr:J domain-containing protein [Phormidium sp. LEGE 05292]MBE9227112.1 J domain-containing protein [Phormidium sp. LEGE 05292]